MPPPPDADLHPVATGLAKATVDKHQDPQELTLYGKATGRGIAQPADMVVLSQRDGCAPLYSAYGRFLKRRKYLTDTLKFALWLRYIRCNANRD